ncbi:MAG: glutaredoxin [candidate division NC10 bacterium]|nr:glutaredoxin [candidate division NC10 bacterium]
MTQLRKVEVFTGGCHLCEEAIRLVKELACPSCEVIIHDLRPGFATEEALEGARGYRINSVPTVVVDGSIAPCCLREGPSIEQLRSIGIGQPI